MREIHKAQCTVVAMDTCHRGWKRSPMTEQETAKRSSEHFKHKSILYNLTLTEDLQHPKDKDIRTLSIFQTQLSFGPLCFIMYKPCISLNDSEYIS